MLDQKTLVKDLNSLLNIYSYEDYGPNGLQIQGSTKIEKVAFAVSATKDSIATAVSMNANALIVHHGLFWKFHGVKTITKSFYHRVAPLIKNDINLLGYHLPLDAHMDLGNAKAIADKLELVDLKAFGDHKGNPTGVSGSFKTPIKPESLKDLLKEKLSHEVIHAKPNDDLIKNIGIITGGANGDWRQAKKENLDSYLTGEISEHDWHESIEDDIHFFAGGHNATEQFGIQNLMEYIQKKYPTVECTFIPSENPA